MREGVGPGFGVDDGDRSHVFGTSVSGRERGHHLVGAGNRLSVQHRHARMLVAEKYHLAGSVRVDRPEVMEHRLAAVDVLPAHVKYASVVQHPRRVVMLDVAGNHADVLAVRVAAVQRGHRRTPARHKPPAAAGNEHHAAVGKVGRLHVVVSAVGELRQPAAVDSDLVKVERRPVPLAVGEQDLFALVVDLRVSDAALRIVQQHLQLAAAQIEPAQPAAGAIAFSLRVVAVVPKIDVPMVPAGNPHGKDDFINQTGFQDPLQQPAANRRGLQLCTVQSARQATLQTNRQHDRPHHRGIRSDADFHGTPFNANGDVSLSKQATTNLTQPVCRMQYTHHTKNPQRRRVEPSASCYNPLPAQRSRK